MPAGGHREAKKSRTRQAISDAATRMFIRDGFDKVTVPDVAQASGVAPATVFNYFRTKEDLFFDRAGGQRQDLLREVERRPPGIPVATAFRAWHVRQIRMLVEPDAAEVVRGMGLTIRASDALRRHEAGLYHQLEQDLANLLTHPDDRDNPVPALLAGQLITIHRCVASLAFTLAIARRPPDECAARTRAATDAGFALLSEQARAWGALPGPGA